MGIIHSLSDIDWFEWNGVKCTQYGMHVLQQPSFIRPAERAEYVEIPGKAGSLSVSSSSVLSLSSAAPAASATKA